MSWITKEQRDAVRVYMEEAEAEMMKKYGRLIYAAPAEELKRIEAEWAATNNPTNGSTQDK